jgi:hypothetical protein
MRRSKNQVLENKEVVLMPLSAERSEGKVMKVPRKATIFMKIHAVNRGFGKIR